MVSPEQRRDPISVHAKRAVIFALWFGAKSAELGALAGENSI